MPKKRFPNNTLDDLGTIPDLERIVALADAATEWVRRHDETIRRLTTNPALEALERQERQLRALTRSPLAEAMQSAASNASLLHAAEALANSPWLKAAEQMANSPMLKAAQLASETLANSPPVKETERWAKLATESPLLDAYKSIENSPLFRMNEALVDQMRLSDRQFAAAAALGARLDESPMFAAARETQAIIDRYSSSLPDWTRIAADFEHFTGASSVTWERFRREAETVAADPDNAEESFTEMATIADAIVAGVPEVKRDAARKFMRDLLIAVLAGAIIEAGKEAGKALSPYLLILMFGVVSIVSPPEKIALPPVPAPAINSPAPMIDWRFEGLPNIVVDAGPDAVRRTVEFFTAEIRNPNTRRAYAHAVQEFSIWCDDRDLQLIELTPFHIAAYIEELSKDRSAPTVKQALAALRMWFDYLVVGQVLPMNPAASVRGPKHIVKRGKTPVLSSEQARALLDSIDISSVVGLRDRAVIGVMAYSFGRVSAVVGMKGEDYYPVGKRWWFRLHEKGGKRHEVPAHHNAEAYVDAYLAAAGIREQRRGPLFRSVGRDRQLSERPMHRTDVLRMIKRRVRVAGLPDSTCCHTFRATGITTYLENGGTVEKAQQIAAHESPRTTKLYDRTSDELTLDEIERIAI